MGQKFIWIWWELHKNYDESSNRGYIFELDVEYLKKLFNLHKDLPFLAERKKIKKCNKLVCNIHYKETMFFTEKL